MGGGECVFKAPRTQHRSYAALKDALDAPGYKSYLFAMGEGDRVMCKRMAQTHTVRRKVTHAPI